MTSIMQTRTDSFTPSLDWLTPFGSWEAAARWNAMAFEWMTNGWKQWMNLTTAWPELEQPGAASAQHAQATTGSALASASEGTQEPRHTRSVHAAEARPRASEARSAKPRASGSRSASGRSAEAKSERTRTERASAGRREGRAAASAGAKPRASKQRAARPQATARSRSRTRG